MLSFWSSCPGDCVGRGPPSEDGAQRHPKPGHTNCQRITSLFGEHHQDFPKLGKSPGILQMD